MAEDEASRTEREQMYEEFDEDETHYTLIDQLFLSAVGDPAAEDASHTEVAAKYETLPLTVCLTLSLAYTVSATGWLRSRVPD